MFDSSDEMTGKRVLVFGSGPMAKAYLEVLRFLDCSVLVVGRDGIKAHLLAESFGYKGIGGGVAGLQQVRAEDFDCVIVAVAVESLCDVTAACLKKGFRRFLVEKPGALTVTELESLKNLAAGADIRIAFNRRYYNSVRMLREAIRRDGGPLGSLFDFTDREKDIVSAHKEPQVVARWGWANSIHVIDTAFHLIGHPESIDCRRSGHWDIHPSGTAFAGSGETKHAGGTVLFSYFATWAGGGRWNVEVSTMRGRYRLSPMEELAFCAKGQFGWVSLPSSDDEDLKFKPGLLKMVRAVLNDPANDLPGLEEQIGLGRVVEKIFGY